MDATFWEHLVLDLELVGDEYGDLGDDPEYAYMRMLDHYGCQGWELVTIDDGKAFMRRPISADQAFETLTKLNREQGWPTAAT